ncbi:HAMP domain protein, partial [Vibrio cholerae CP1035(8)]
SLPV